jgi:DNA polymerase-3 subunit alpha (Gram-positive type)
MGMPAKAAFDIMENVRKGKKLAPGQDMENAMKEHNVPGWFIESCKKIGYLFPKGHAVAYVTMALRIAWFKVYHPLEYYAAYFTIRAKGFDAETMLCPPQYVRKLLEDLQESDIKEQTGSDKDEIVALEVVLEMLARGFTFLPVDLYRSQVKEFTKEGNALRCPFTSLKGFGEQAAISIVEERKQPFLSTEDLKKRTRITNTGIEMLRKCGTMEDLSDTNQLSFF